MVYKIQVITLFIVLIALAILGIKSIIDAWRGDNMDNLTVTIPIEEYRMLLEDSMTLRRVSYIQDNKEVINRIDALNQYLNYLNDKMNKVLDIK